jgi:acylglycerol lipase
MAEYFAKNKFVVNMIDLRSFGYSGGLRVNEPVRGLLSDIENLLRRCCEIGLPTYVLSHGFGCLLVLALLEENPKLPLAGVIAMSPLFSFPFFTNTSWVGKSVLWLLSFLFEDMIINNMINPTSLTNNLRKVKGCIDGVFSYQFISINMVQ